MSRALRANEAIPSGPVHQVRSASSWEIAALSSGSRPITRSDRPSIITSVARHASAHIVIASPHPTTPSVVSMRHSVNRRSAPLSFGSGYSTEIGSTRAILPIVAPPWTENVSSATVHRR